MNIRRYDPWTMLDQINREMNRALASRYDNEDNSSVDTADWSPAVDIKEVKDAFVLHADIPGVSPEDIEVTMEKGLLTIKGERKAVTEEEKDGYKRVERVRGSFFRRFSLPDTADAEHISAKGEHGVLTVTIPKKPEVQPRRIDVQVH